MSLLVQSPVKLLGRIAATPSDSYTRNSLIGLSVCSCVCWSRSWSLRQPLDRSRCRLELSRMGQRNHVLDGHTDPSRWRGNFRPSEEHWEPLHLNRCLCNCAKCGYWRRRSKTDNMPILREVGIYWGVTIWRCDLLSPNSLTTCLLWLRDRGWLPLSPRTLDRNS